MIAQVAGAIVGAWILWVIASGQPNWIPGGFASNDMLNLALANTGLLASFAIEVLLTFFFVVIIVGTTSKGAAVGFAGIPIGLALVLIHLISIPATNTSVNPARSTGPALFAGSPYVAQLWMFWSAPLLGAVIGGLFARWMYEPADIVEIEVVERR